VHDREDAGVAEVALLDFDVVLEQPLHLAVAFREARRRARRMQRVDLAAREHRRERLAGADTLDADFPRQVELELGATRGHHRAVGDLQVRPGRRLPTRAAALIARNANAKRSPAPTVP
jgi:hypothetical protein